MDFTYTDEQLALQDTLKRFISKDYSFDKRTQFSKSADGYSKEAWNTYAELGILALPFPEELDGLGGTAIDTMLVMDILGKGLILEPYISSIVISGGIINAFGSDPQKQEFIPKLASGEIKISLAHYEPKSRYSLNDVTTSASKSGAIWKITGQKSVVLQANSVDYLLVSARTSGNNLDESGVSIFLVRANQPGITVTTYETQDGGRAADVAFKDVEVSSDQLIGQENSGVEVLNKAIDLANAAICAEAVGIMTAVNEITLEYLKTRKQFGVPIGKFQALQHRMADMILTTEQSRSMAILAAAAQSNPDQVKRARDTAAAKAYICKAARHIGQEAVQLHGGMGVTEELNIGHYFKRLTMISLTFGDFDYHIDKVSTSLLSM
jgi:alkylation response protein AidB-like acyl-CoA dehydrogenase